MSLDVPWCTFLLKSKPRGKLSTLTTFQNLKVGLWVELFLISAELKVGSLTFSRWAVRWFCHQLQSTRWAGGRWPIRGPEDAWSGWLHLPQGCSRLQYDRSHHPGRGSLCIWKSTSFPSGHCCDTCHLLASWWHYLPRWPRKVRSSGWSWPMTRWPHRKQPKLLRSSTRNCQPLSPLR